jgi:hypothetical protein
VSDYYKKRPRNWAHKIWINLFDNSLHRILKDEPYGYPETAICLRRLQDWNLIIVPKDKFDQVFRKIDINKEL